MNHPHSRHDPLLDELLAGAELEPLRESALRLMLAESRRARQQRQALAAAALALAPVLAALALLGHHLSGSRPSTPAVAALAPVEKAAPSAPEPAPAARPGLRIVTDKELLALFPDRPVALVGPPGRQRLVFLDRPGTE